MEKKNTKKSVRVTAEIKITARENGKKIAERKATSISGMWKVNKSLFAEFPGATLFVKKDGAAFMKLHLATKSNGKTWMVNDIVESRRGHGPKAEAAEEPAQEIHTIAEAEPAAEEAVTAEA